ncbi:swi5-dependent recombination DNA repair protein 1 homolog [Vidua macroura]|uniref:swi5-dependent recombination DNA repair protein 1 homolog n=1 Tax=Vidua macroura TaxID=187451 RepID=UPI0023A8657E|nr:swi5-dependent recombination DNA repair protein 1 homolog [Vidua macroura]
MCAPQATLCPSDRTASGEPGGCEGQVGARAGGGTRRTLTCSELRPRRALQSRSPSAHSGPGGARQQHRALRPGPPTAPGPQTSPSDRALRPRLALRPRPQTGPSDRALRPRPAPPLPPTAPEAPGPGREGAQNSSKKEPTKWLLVSSHLPKSGS